MKRPNLRIIGTEREESQHKNAENILKKITEENFPNLKEWYKNLTEHQIDCAGGPYPDRSIDLG